MKNTSKKENANIDKIISELDKAIAAQKETIETLTVYPHRKPDGLYANVEWHGGNCKGLLNALDIVRKIKNGNL